MSDIIIAAIASLSLGSLTGFLVYINWKILKETIIIREESIRVRKAIGEDEILDDTK